MPLPLPSDDPHPLAAGLLQTDAFHRQPLFVVQPPAGSRWGLQVVRSWNEAHALHGPARPTDVNPAYVAALISGNHCADTAPYRRIRRLPRAHLVLIGGDGSLQTSPYDPLAGGAEAMEAHKLHLFLRQGLLDHVRKALEGHAGAIGCEHSSGLDSNAVLGALVHGSGVSPQRLHTWSNEDDGEGPPLAEFRPFFRLLPDQCHRFSGNDLSFKRSEQQLQQQLRQLGAPAQIGGIPQAVAQLRAQGCTLLFSGHGGDQALSHNANNVPSDLLAQGRWQELIQWMGGRRAALQAAGGRALALLHRPWAVRRVLRRSSDFWASDLLAHTLTAEGLTWLSPHIKVAYPWEVDGYVPQHVSIRQRVLADWVTVRAEEETRVAAAQGMVKVFPLLDERLIATLLHQDPALFGEGMTRGRLLHRLAFAPFLPPLLRDQPSKARPLEGNLQPSEGEWQRLHHQLLAHQLECSATWHPALGQWWDLAAIRHQAESLLGRSTAAQHDLRATHRALAKLTALSGWWQALDS